uniref:Predicted protein n=1 Tax=Hordeum vulgare subsp. vulgare TaxID=112509 RepID=F2E097_HORVV|nr:predicted protein [Hordeum vulgare subsp. vulgare]
MIEVGGLIYSSPSCTPCPIGTFSLVNATEDCLLCPENTFNNQTGRSSVCDPCPEDTFAPAGSSQCSQTPPCTENDLQILYTPCNNGTRDSYYIWKQSCNSKTGISLPSNQTSIPCAPCHPGQYRNYSTWECEYCPVGSSSPGDVPCSLCLKGSAAIKEVHVTEWFELPANSETDAWTLTGSSLVTSTSSFFTWNIDLETEGSVTFNATITCNSSCSLVFVASLDHLGYLTRFLRSGSSTFNLKSGQNELTWTFFGEGVVELNSVVVYGVSEGGAGNCTECVPGTYSSTDGQSFCLPCEVGSAQSLPGSISCETCENNTFTEFEGRTECLSCGEGTQASSNHTFCSTDCIYTAAPGITFNLTSLPQISIYISMTTYTMNICNKVTGSSCLDRDRNPLNTHICSSGRVMGATDLGRVLSFGYNTSLYTSFKYGDMGCGYSYINGTVLDAVPRTTSISLVCDLSQDPPTGTPYLVSSTMCHYEFVWPSVYACPLCSSEHYSFLYTQCINNKQQKIYFWKQNPKTCYGGVQLPVMEELNCTSPDKKCLPGQFLAGNNCTDCPSGFYSIGGGSEYTEWNTMPINFMTSCEGLTCSGWTPSTHVISAGQGTSLLKYTSLFLEQGTIEFSYRIDSNKAILNFYVDNELVFESGNKLFLEFEVYSYNKLLPGNHSFVWEYVGDGNVAAIKYVKVMGNVKAAIQCTPCPFGYYSNVTAASQCLPCPMNTFSTGQASECSPCSSSQYSLEASNFCTDRPSCSKSDFQDFYTSCSADNTRTHYLAVVDPYICVPSASITINNVSLSHNETVSCGSCPPGSYRNGTICVGCPSGAFLSNGKCVVANKGQAAVSVESYWIDNSLDTWPQGFSTGCEGSCGSRGWRLRGDHIDSGFHGYDLDIDVDSWLLLETRLVSPGYISFDVLTTKMIGQLEFYINGNSINPLLGKYELMPGNYSIVWKYHQSSLETRDIASIANILIAGGDSGFNQNYMCPPGTYSGNEGSSSCKQCDPGYFSSSYGNHQCYPCSSGYMSPGYGSTTCIQCGTGTSSAEAASHCDSKCLFYVNDTIYYSIQDLYPIQYIDNEGHHYTLNLCDMNADNSSICTGYDGQFHFSYICNSQLSFGSMLSFTANEPDLINKGFSLQFSYGSASGCSNYRTSTVTFICASEEESEPVPQIVPEKSNCEAYFVWTSIHGCPLCSSKDYETTETTCVNGEKNVFDVRKNKCHGEKTRNSRVVSCSKSIVFPVWAIVIIAVGTLAAVISFAVYFVKHRKMSQQYSRLLQDKNTNVEMEAVPIEKFSIVDD